MDDMDHKKQEDIWQYKTHQGRSNKEVKGNNKLETRNRKSNNKNRRQNKEKDLPKGLGAEKLELYSGREPKKV